MDRTEVVVVGAGRSALDRLAARPARPPGRPADRGEPAAEATSAAGGALIPTAGGVSAPLLALYLRSLAQYAAFVQEVRETTAAAVEYRAPGRLLLALDEARESELGQDVERQRAAGVRVEWLSGDEARRSSRPSCPTSGLRSSSSTTRWSTTSGSARWSPDAAARAGVELRAHEAVLALALEGDRVVGVETVRGRVAADRVVLAAGCWSSQLTPWLRGATGPAKGEMIALQATSPRPLERLVSIHGVGIVPRGDGLA